MQNEISREEFDAKLIAAGVNPAYIAMGHVLTAIKMSAPYPSHLTTEVAFAAELALMSTGKIYQDEATGRLMAR